ncbi:MAG: DUF721 domain-containing protein [Syntrophaceae bacterium]|nr:DUF721 domain-containing protein [Syntrophaceae bacterium]
MRRKGSPKLEPLGQIIRKVAKREGLPLQAADLRLLTFWDRTVGPQVAAQTYPEDIRRGILQVRVSSSVWMHQLQFLKEDILRKLQGVMGSDSVKGFRFSIGEIPRPAPAPKPETPPSEILGTSLLKPRDRRLIEENLTVVADPELRELLRRVMTKDLLRRRIREQRKGRP